VFKTFSVWRPFQFLVGQQLYLSQSDIFGCLQICRFWALTIKLTCPLMMRFEQKNCQICRFQFYRFHGYNKNPEIKTQLLSSYIKLQFVDLNKLFWYLKFVYSQCRKIKDSRQVLIYFFVEIVLYLFYFELSFIMQLLNHKMIF